MRAANTVAWPSSGARILGSAPTTDGGNGDRPEEEEEVVVEEEEEAEAEGSRCCSFPHPLALRGGETTQATNKQKQQ